MRIALLMGLGVLAALVALAVWAHLPRTPLPAGARADLLVLEKGERRLSVYSQGALLRSYRVALGRNPVGPKRREGDRRTPEGRYLVDRHRPGSGYHRALHLSYPSSADTARARAAGVAPGGDVMIHGLRNGLGWIGRAHLLMDWTYGCIALSDPEIDELYRIVADGTPIELRP
jgi:murein L,D-transpeptidase YafK